MLIEVQLADAIDLMTGALQAGGGVTSALENAIAETRRPLRPQLEDVLGRIRFGDDPQAVLRSLAARVPLETFRLFASVLSVHWEIGGSLAPTLATVGRQVRDRIELSRRLRSLTVQSRASTIAVQFRSKLPAKHGLLLLPCSSLHTFWMRFAIDIAWIDSTGAVIAIQQHVRPWQVIVGPQSAHAVLELPAGTNVLMPGERRPRRCTGAAFQRHFGAIFVAL
jgi:uncharacterized membrane protein (UPF0127 family)